MRAISRHLGVAGSSSPPSRTRGVERTEAGGQKSPCVTACSLQGAPEGEGCWAEASSVVGHLGTLAISPLLVSIASLQPQSHLNPQCMF